MCMGNLAGASLSRPKRLWQGWMGGRRILAAPLPLITTPCLLLIPPMGTNFHPDPATFCPVTPRPCPLLTHPANWSWWSQMSHCCMANTTHGLQQWASKVLIAHHILWYHKPSWTARIYIPAILMEDRIGQCIFFPFQRIFFPFKKENLSFYYCMNWSSKKMSAS